MNKLILLITFLFSSQAMAVGVFCGDAKQTFRHPSGSYFDICPTTSSDLNIFAYSRGSKTHSCNLEAVAKKGNNDYSIKEGSCTVIFTITGNTLSATFSSKCKRAACGLNANWKNGEFTK